jgi:hypothetical protein
MLRLSFWSSGVEKVFRTLEPEKQNNLGESQQSKAKPCLVDFK